LRCGCWTAVAPLANLEAMMECTFQVGDRVVCVDATDTNNLGLPELNEGHIYEVRAVEAAKAIETEDFSSSDGAYSDTRAVVKVAEVNPRCRFHDEGFAAARFRPVKPLSFWLGEKQELRVKA